MRASQPEEINFITYYLYKKKLLALAARTGVEYFAMATHSNVDDLIQPVWLGSPGAAIFLANGPQMNAWDLLRQFEQSCCARKFCKLFITPGNCTAIFN